MANYVQTLVEFKALSVMPASDLDQLEAEASGWILNQTLVASAWVDSRLRKRYAVPFSAPVPDIVRSWVVRMVTLRAYLRRGVNASDDHFAEVKADAEAAGLEVKEAADAESGLFDLPLRQDTATSGVTKPAPLGYSESSPYTWTDVQADGGR